MGSKISAFLIGWVTKAWNFEPQNHKLIEIAVLIMSCLRNIFFKKYSILTHLF